MNGSINGSQIEVDPFLFLIIKTLSVNILPVLNGISAISNLIPVIALIAYKLKNRTRTYIKFIFMSQFLLCLFCSIGSQETGIITDESDVYNNLYTHILRVYFLKAFNEILSSCIGFAELALSIEKIYLFRNRKIWLTKIKTTYIIGFISIFSTIQLFPEFFLSQIEYKSPGVYKRSLNFFGKSLIYSVYINSLSFTVLTVIVLHIINIILLAIEYKKFLINKKKWNLGHKSKNNIIIFIFIQSFLYYITCLLYMISTAKISIDAIFNVPYDPTTIVIRYLLHVYQPINFFLCSLLVFYYDEQLNRNLTRIFLKKK